MTTGKWKNERFGEIEVGDTTSMRNAVETMFDDGDLRDDFSYFVSNNRDIVYDFIDNDGDLTDVYEDMKTDFIQDKVDEFSEGCTVEIGGETFDWVEEPTREIVLMVKMTITDLQVDINQFVRQTMERTFEPEALTVEVLKDEKEQEENKE